MSRASPPPPLDRDDVNPTLASNHIDDTVQAIVRMHTEHDDRATAADRLFSWLTARLASAGCIVGTCLVATGWIGANLIAPLLGRKSFDPPPFALLQSLATLGALFVTLLILAEQRRDDRIATQREQLSLQLAMLNDRKLAKLIALLEEQRRDHPSLRNRADPEAEALAKPADPHAVLDAIERG